MKSTEYIFFLSEQGTFSRIDHVGTQKSLNKFKKIEIISNTSYHNGIKLKIIHKKKNEKHMQTWRLTNMLPNNEWVNNEIREKIKRNLETKYENTKIQKSMGYGESSPEREIHRITNLPQEQEKSQISNLTHRGTKKEQLTKLRVEERK